MKRFFSKSSKNQPSTSAVSQNNDLVVHTPVLPPKIVVPPVLSPRPHDYIAILPTQDGLLLRPHVARQGESDHYVRITWGKVPEIEELQGAAHNASVNWAVAVIVYGIVGILELFTESYLLVITSRLEVGQVLHESRKVYAIKDVTAIPLGGFQHAASVTSTVARANAAKARSSLLMDVSRNHSSENAGSLDDVGNRVKFAEEHEVKVMTPVSVDRFSALDRPPSPASVVSVASSLSSEVSAAPVANVLANRLSFWNKLSKTSDAKSSNVESVAKEETGPLDSLIHEDMPEPQEVLNRIIETAAPPPTTIREKYTELEAKILRQTVKEFAKGEIYFAYDFDITHSLQHKQEQIAKTQKQNVLLAELDALDTPVQSVASSEDVDVLAEPLPTLPLWRRVDRQFWWNEHLSKPFIDAGLHPYILPLVQGYFQVASFSIPQDSEPVEPGDTTHIDYIIMSRRSRDRAGLRYQRRGIDDEAHVANFVETETITRVDRDNVTNVFSYVQIRGSIPLFWTQTGPGLKPPPQLSSETTHERNMRSFIRHFKRTLPIYGPHTIVNLAEQHGKEGVVTNAYREYAEEAQLSNVKYCQYDFHAETKGMKYENISKLITQLERSFESQGFLWVSDSVILSRQKGVYRVNCIDCLDRTNVVQSAFARHVLNQQLLALVLLNPSGPGHTEIDVVFNDVWANNGDAISRCYAGTSALKSDFTRTGKRDLGGLLNDGINSLARMYTSTFNDWFCQVVIDYMLGFRTLSVFSEFLLKLQSTDPRELIRLSNIRAEAIATCVSRVLEEGETLLSGWTLFSPTALNTKLGEKFEEKVLLLSRVALYIISFEYNLEKVKVSTPIPLRDIVSITKGAYIISPLEEASRDPVQNAGFVVEWRNTRQLTRVTSYSLRNSVELPSSLSGPSVSANNASSMFAGRTSDSPTGSSTLVPLSSISQRQPTATSSATVASPSTNKPAVIPPPPRTSTASTTKYRPSLSRMPAAAATARLSRLLSSAALPTPAPTPETSSAAGADADANNAASANTTNFAAFKALPIDRTRREGSGSTFVEPSAPDELAGVSTCQEAVDLMVDAIVSACEDAHARTHAHDSAVSGIGKGKGEVVPSVRKEDIVSLAEARRMTSMYTKMEYGVKRLLWLGS
ncbi:SacI homology domain-containing protein [Russula ochroleuca]|uniref:SacI homology domain-containing protein n=1 Tax=Russula ochroleuca TaxID=152965 RepID=A0A9P5MU39_9AGAM|nr:SacI homology domain-containing protein [Russula ochroleuca]